MKRKGETLHYGSGEYATFAARLRNDGNYIAAAGIETWTGERRHCDNAGQTMFAKFPGVWSFEHDRRCNDLNELRAWVSEEEVERWLKR